MSGQPLVRQEALVELAERALSHLSCEGQVTLVHERSLTSRFARSVPTQATEVDDVTVNILCVLEGQTGAAVIAPASCTLAALGAAIRNVARPSGYTRDSRFFSSSLT